MAVGEDKLLKIWDSRDLNLGKTDAEVSAHVGDINALSLKPFDQNLVLTAGRDNLTDLWDSRYMGKSLHAFEGYADMLL